MDIGTAAAWVPDLDLGAVEAVALRLERCAEAVEVHAARTRLGTSTTWRGGASELHRQRVAAHGEDLSALADRVRRVASGVRALGATAAARVSLREEIDAGTGRWR